jgi:hypothetical protein
MSQWPGNNLMVSPYSPEVWTNSAIRKTENVTTSNATREIVCFEVLDYDSLTYVKVGDGNVNVVAAIYKKVTISHTQQRKYSLIKEDLNEPNTKFNSVPTMPAWYLDNTPATDYYAYSGSRKIEYILCLVVGEVKYVFSLGEVNISVAGYYNLEGENIDLIEDAAALSQGGPFFTVSGDRLYGVSVNCGLEVVTYSYDVEERNDRPVSNHILLQIDSPMNVEDINEFWQKKHRVVGAMTYEGKGESKIFSDELPDTVMAVGYGYV